MRKVADDIGVELSCVAGVSAALTDNLLEGDISGEGDVCDCSIKTGPIG